MNLRKLHDKHGRVCNHCLKSIDEFGKSIESCVKHLNKEIICVTEEEYRKPLPKTSIRKKIHCKHCECKTEYKIVYTRLDRRPVHAYVTIDEYGTYRYHTVSNTKWKTCGTDDISGYLKYTGGKWC